MEEASHRAERPRLTTPTLSSSPATMILRKVVKMPFSVLIEMTPNIQSNKSSLRHKSEGISSQYLTGAEIKASQISELQTRGIGKSSFLMRTSLAIKEWPDNERVVAMDVTSHTTRRVRSNYLEQSSLPLRLEMLFKVTISSLNGAQEYTN